MTGGAMSWSLSFPGPRSAWHGYCSALERRPVATKSLTSLVGFMLGDALAQLGSRPSRQERQNMFWRYDTYRTVRMAAYGGLVGGPLGHAWYNFLDGRIFPKAPKSWMAITSKIGLDQALMNPLGTGLFFAWAKLMDGQPGAVLPTVHEKLVPTCLASLKLWPAAHALNFAFIPPEQRVLYINVISIFWTFLLSQAASAGVKTEVLPASPPQLVVVPVPENEFETVASVGFLEDMEALENEYSNS